MLPTGRDGYVYAYIYMLPAARGLIALDRHFDAFLREDRQLIRETLLTVSAGILLSHTASHCVTSFVIFCAWIYVCGIWLLLYFQLAVATLFFLYTAHSKGHYSHISTYSTHTYLFPVTTVNHWWNTSHMFFPLLFPLHHWCDIRGHSTPHPWKSLVQMCRLNTEQLIKMLPCHDAIVVVTCLSQGFLL